MCLACAIWNFRSTGLSLSFRKMSGWAYALLGEALLGLSLKESLLCVILLSGPKSGLFEGQSTLLAGPVSFFLELAWHIQLKRRNVPTGADSKCHNPSLHASVNRQWGCRKGGWGHLIICQLSCPGAFLNIKKDCVKSYYLYKSPCTFKNEDRKKKRQWISESHLD